MRLHFLNVPIVAWDRIENYISMDGDNFSSIDVLWNNGTILIKDD